MRQLSLSRQRSGKVLVLFALLLPVLLGMLGLVIDMGLILTSHRQIHNGADTAAQAAAMSLLEGKSLSEAEAIVEEILDGMDDVEGFQLTLNHPPASGAYAGNDQYVEAILRKSVKTWFIQVIEGPSSQDVSARAVAGIERHPVSALLMTLSQSTSPGLSLVAGPVEVNAPVIVNSHGSGWDENGNYVSRSNPLFSILTGLTGELRAPEVTVVGGVDFPGNFVNTDPQGGSPLKAGSRPRSDPFRSLETPTTSNGIEQRYPSFNGMRHATPQNVAVVLGPGGSITFEPGIYGSISVTGAGAGSSVTFEPGIYVLNGSLPAALNIATTADVTGDGVMFYNTGTDIDVVTGLPDADDKDSLLPLPTNPSFGSITIAAPNLTFKGLDDPTSPFDGMLFYQRRRNVLPISLDGGLFDGTVYGKWSHTSLLPGNHKAQIVSSTATLTSIPLLVGLKLSPGRRAKAPQVYLVE